MSKPMNTYHLDVKVDECDECGTTLKEIGEELYCEVCDCGDGVEPDANGDVMGCVGCGITLATYFPYDSCPKCYNKVH
jgi:hypothetical protein